MRDNIRASALRATAKITLTALVAGCGLIADDPLTRFPDASSSDASSDGGRTRDAHADAFDAWFADATREAFVDAPFLSDAGKETSFVEEAGNAGQSDAATQTPRSS